MNVKLLRKVAKHILAEPKRFCGQWARRTDASPCGTQACIAGWALVLGGNYSTERLLKLSYSSKASSIRHRAQKLLKISTDQAHRLFVSWPLRQGDIFSATAGRAAARIEHFIKTKGRE